MADWETDEYTRHLPKPPVGNLVQAIKYYKTPNVQLTLEGASPSDYFKQVQAAGFEQIAYNEFMIDSDPAADPVINGLFTNGEWSVSMSASGGTLTIAIIEGEFKVWNQ